MKVGLRRLIFPAVGAVLVCLLGITSAAGQAAPQPGAQAALGDNPVMAEQVFKNVQLLKGISVKEFMETMGFFAAATNNTCTVCHGDASAGSWEHYADDPPMKQTARKMMLMVDGINRTYFGGKRQVTCYSCHRNADLPKITPNLAEQYSSPPSEDPDVIPGQAPRAPSAQEVLDKYVQAMGGERKLDGFTSFVARGTYLGYDDPIKRDVEIYAKAPGQFAQVVHGPDADSSWIDNGRSAWVAQPPASAPVPLLALTAGDLDGAHLESELYFPLSIRQALTNLRVGFPVSGVLSIVEGNVVTTAIDDRELTVVQGSTAAGTSVKLYFDPKSGLLVRMVRYTNLPFGLIPTEIDFADYRDVSGFQVPFRVTKTWVDGRSVTELTSINVNVPIDAAKFAKPAAPVVAKP